MAETALPPNVCANCGKKASSLCSACRSVAFCDSICQRAAWRGHKGECRRLATALASSRDGVAVASEPLKVKPASVDARARADTPFGSGSASSSSSGLIGCRDASRREDDINVTEADELWSKGVVEYLDAVSKGVSMYGGLDNFQASLRFDGKHSDRHYFAACLLVAAGKMEEAVETFEAAILADSSSEIAHMDLVLLLDHLNRPLAARAAAARALEQNIRWTDPWQRVPIFVPGLVSRPWWNKDDFDWSQSLELSYPRIRMELVQLMCAKGSRSGSMPEGWVGVGSERASHDAHIISDGDWREFVIFGAQAEDPDVAKHLPQTKSILEQIVPGAVAMAKVGAGEIIFSALSAGTHLAPHCASSNVRLTCHLGLVIPRDGARIRVADSWRTWETGKCLFFDDSFEHEVIHEGQGLRIVLLIRFWHPDLPCEKWLPTLERGAQDMEELKQRRLTPPMSPAVKKLISGPMQRHIEAHGFGPHGVNADKDPLSLLHSEAGALGPGMLT